MKLLRYKDGKLVKPGILDKENKVRNVSSLVEDWNNVTISTENLNRIKNADLSPSTTDIPSSKSKLKGSGIYALYDDHGLYYVGLTNFSLRARIEKHTKNRHKGKWNRFSWYQIPNLKYTKDMESAILRIVNPKGNKVKGKLKKKKI